MLVTGEGKLWCADKPKPDLAQRWYPRRASTVDGRPELLHVVEVVELVCGEILSSQTVLPLAFPLVPGSSSVRFRQ